MAFYRNFDGLEQILYEYHQPKMAAAFDTIRQNPPDSVKFDTQLKFFDAFGDVLLLSADRGFEPIIMRIFTEKWRDFTLQMRMNTGQLSWQPGFMQFGENGCLRGSKNPLKKLWVF